MSSVKIILPGQKKGARSDTYYSVRAANEQTAKHLYQNARLNLLNVNSWHLLTKSEIVFHLVNEEGKEIDALVEKGNYFRISIPLVPPNKEGNGDEWVQVEKIEEGNLKYHEYISIRVRPSAPPLKKNSETAHFFSNEATSTFSLVRNNNRVTVSVSGRNERPNTDTHNFITGIRNVIIALGAMIGFNKPQWKSLAKGIIKKKAAVLRTPVKM
jgi:hypothetical protein